MTDPTEQSGQAGPEGAAGAPSLLDPTGELREVVGRWRNEGDLIQEMRASLYLSLTCGAFAG